MKKNLFPLLLAILTLPIVLLAQRQIQQFLSRAALRPANIIIETKSVSGPVNKSWAAFAQGGEEPPPMLSSVVSKMRELFPMYIRIDHIYDSYNIVQKNGNTFTYDFSTLDKTVDDIIAMGALPFFSLSYMPGNFTSSGSVIDNPSDWETWKNLVKATIAHYSGINNRNLNNVYYEVWNEPELAQFGEWKMGGSKDYRLLYFYASKGANEANNVNKFYLGGPAVGSYYPDWVNKFVSYISQNNLRLDFYSWHRYTKKPQEYVTDAQNIRNLLSNYPSYANIPLIMTEWGIDSQNSSVNNSNTAAAYSIYSIAQFYKYINLAFHFEIKDGPPGAGGKWGLLTHENDPTHPLFPKPKFTAFRELAQLSGNQILLTGDGTYVSGLASSLSASTTDVVLANYDPAGQNIENVPVTFTGLTPAIYNLKYRYALDNRSGFYEIPVTNGNISKTFLMPANSILSLELTKISPQAAYIDGTTGNPDDKALALNNLEEPLTFNVPEFHLLPTGSISFDIKPFWDRPDSRSFYIFEVPFETTAGIMNKLSLSKQKTITGNSLVFSVSQIGKETAIPFLIDNWEANTWHHLEVGWDQSQLWFAMDGQKIQTSASMDIRNGKTLTFSPVDAAMDNLKIMIGTNQILERHFDGRIDN